MKHPLNSSAFWSYQATFLWALSHLASHTFSSCTSIADVTPVPEGRGGLSTVSGKGEADGQMLWFLPKGPLCEWWHQCCFCSTFSGWPTVDPGEAGCSGQPWPAKDRQHPPEPGVHSAPKIWHGGSPHYGTSVREHWLPLWHSNAFQILWR